MKTILGFNDYLIDEEGNIWSNAQRANRGRPESPVLKKLWISEGYKATSLCKNGRQYKRFLHQLLLENFVGKRPKGMVCRHLDGNKLNNNLSNLCWGTYSENQMDRINAGNSNRGESHGMSKYSREFVAFVREECKHKMQKQVAKELNIPKSTVSNLINKGWAWLK